jgi:hypothetical protein
VILKSVKETNKSKQIINFDNKAVNRLVELETLLTSTFNILPSLRRYIRSVLKGGVLLRRLCGLWMYFPPASQSPRTSCWCHILGDNEKNVQPDSRQKKRTCSRSRCPSDCNKFIIWNLLKEIPGNGLVGFELIGTRHKVSHQLFTSKKPFAIALLKAFLEVSWQSQD